MGMIMSFDSVSEKNLLLILADPPLVYRVTESEEPEVVEIVRQAQSDIAKKSSKKGLLGRLFGEKSSPSKPKLQAPINAKTYEELEVQEMLTMDIDKAWQALHFILTGTAWDGEHPENFLLAGGVELEDINFGEGAPRCFTPMEVTEICVCVNAITPNEFTARYEKVTQSDEVYNPGDRDYSWFHFEALRQYLNTVNKADQGLVITLS